MTHTITSPKESIEAKDFLPLKGTDYIELYVGNSPAGSSLL